jgi:HPt (histidine-containing phosphotransfer) domain-containing protein
MDENIINEFLVESHESLNQVEGDVVALERDPSDRKRLASVFRTVHTIKGTCGFFGFSKLESVAHAGETLLSQLRNGEADLNLEIAGALLALVDGLRANAGRGRNGLLGARGDSHAASIGQWAGAERGSGGDRGSGRDRGFGGDRDTGRGRGAGGDRGIELRSCLRLCAGGRNDRWRAP